jgi:Mrp family chromosome partitioning ATPase
LSGFWFEVQTPKQEVKYRHIMPDPIKVYTEVPGPAPEPRPERSEAVRTEAVFTVLIPQVPGSNNLVLVSSSLGVAGNATAAQPLAHIPLAERSK